MTQDYNYNPYQTKTRKFTPAKIGKVFLKLFIGLTDYAKSAIAVVGIGFTVILATGTLAGLNFSFTAGYHSYPINLSRQSGYFLLIAFLLASIGYFIDGGKEIVRIVKKAKDRSESKHGKN